MNPSLLRLFPRCLIPLGLVLTASLVPAAGTIPVSRGPGQTAKPMEVRVLADLPDFVRESTPRALSRFGGDATQPKSAATGFFRVEKIGDRWWMIDPEGHRYFNNAVNSVEPGSPGSLVKSASLVEKFGDVSNWARATSDLLREVGFNGVGAWSHHASLRAIERPLPYTPVLDLMKQYRSHRGGVVMEGNYERFLEGVPFVFDPGFETFARARLARFAHLRDDPWVVGVFSDNELPFPRDALDRYLRLAPTEPGHQEAQRWRLAHFGGAAAEHQPEITDEERDLFLNHVLGTYFGLMRRLVKETLPNHLYLGSRLHGRATFNAEVWAAVAPHVDVLSANVYFWWNPPLERMRSSVARMNKPFMITEWYAKGMDTGLPNVTGAGWLVPTQADRGRFYQHFLLTLLEAGGCVGSHWFMYMDNDPADPSAGPSNRDSNKGMVDIRHQPHADLVSAMRELNSQVYPLMEHFDRRR